jgi:hypothetical protein
MKRIPVSIYFMPEWWDRHYHGTAPRPGSASQGALESLYLGRQRFLFEQFGGFGLGQERPRLGGGQIATVIRYGFDLVPVLLGTAVELKDAWGFYPQARPLDELRRLSPVDISRHPEADRIRREKERLESLYGTCSHCVDIGSVCNNAFRIAGEDVYAGLAGDPGAVRGLFEVILQTEEHLYRLLRELFPPMDPVPISNCNVHVMGPRLYGREVLPFDARQNRFAGALGGAAGYGPAMSAYGAAPRAALHHCDVPADDFLECYRRLPGVASLQASFRSDIAAAKAALGGCQFSAMVGPRAVAGPPSDLGRDIERALSAGADDLPLWNVDAAIGVVRFREVLSAVRSACRACACEAEFSALPLCWEEIEWAHARYCPV